MARSFSWRQPSVSFGFLSLAASSNVLSGQLLRPRAPEVSCGAAKPRVAVIDGPYDAASLAGVLAREPIQLGVGSCAILSKSACDHGTFIMGLLGARKDALVPGVCWDCEFVHVPLFVDEDTAQASLTELAQAINLAVLAGAKLINLSLAILGNGTERHRGLAEALDRAERSGAVVVAAAGNQGCLASGQILSHPVTIPVVAVDEAGRLLPESNFGPSISHRGVAAFGRAARGYAPSGGITTMSGTSVATAFATGILAQAWGGPTGCRRCHRPRRHRALGATSWSGSASAH
jgi:subtilisin family serine protease